MSLLTGGRSSSRKKFLAFAIGALAIGSIGYASVASLGFALPGSSGERVRWAVVAGGMIAAVWYLHPSQRWLLSTRYQLRRELAYGGYVGATVYGGILGLGLLTIVVTPLVWVGALAAFASGSVLWGGVYGASFGLGRSSQLFIHYLRGVRDREAETVAWTLSLVDTFRLVGLVSALLLVAAAWLLPN